MKLYNLIFIILLVFFILLIGGFLNKKEPVTHPNIIINDIKPGDTITSPLVITGEARGIWYFEADFPIFLLDENENQLAIAIAQAQDEWMTENFVPFKADLEFDTDEKINGFLLFKKDNPTGLMEFDDEFRIPIVININ